MSEQTQKQQEYGIDRLSIDATESSSEAFDKVLLERISHVKRFIERCQADPSFREQLSVDPRTAVDRYHLNIDPEEIRPLWDLEYTQEADTRLEEFPLLEQYHAFNARNNAFREVKSVSTSLKEPRFKQWRERQINRTESQFKQQFYHSILHFPVCFELSKGCSVGCWFCGVAAPKLSDLFLHTPENQQLWREVLELLNGILGPAAGSGFCYWATDPLDNPDYEAFCEDFYQVFGIFPSTTTALALRDPARTRSLLRRFSGMNLPTSDYVECQESNGSLRNRRK